MKLSKSQPSLRGDARPTPPARARQPHLAVAPLVLCTLLGCGTTTPDAPMRCGVDGIESKPGSTPDRICLTPGRSDAPPTTCDDADFKSDALALVDLIRAGGEPYFLPVDPASMPENHCFADGIGADCPFVPFLSAFLTGTPADAALMDRFRSCLAGEATGEDLRPVLASPPGPQPTQWAQVVACALGPDAVRWHNRVHLRDLYRWLQAGSVVIVRFRAWERFPRFARVLGLLVFRLELVLQDDTTFRHAKASFVPLIEPGIQRERAMGVRFTEFFEEWKCPELRANYSEYGRGVEDMLLENTSRFAIVIDPTLVRVP